MPPPVESAWLEVDLGALMRNAAALGKQSGVPLLPMVKADGYGLGAEAVVGVLETLSPWGYGVATVEEGEALRRAGIQRPVVVFTPLSNSDLPAARAARLTPSLARDDDIRAWSRYGIPYHLSVDTGMCRAGVPWREVESLRPAVAVCPPEGAFTHFHSAELDNSSADEQEGRFREALATLPVRPSLLHAESSAAIARRGRSEWDLVRPGIFMYGVGSGDGTLIEPEPVVTMRARVVETRVIEAGDTVSYDATYAAPSRRLIATVPVGYADGYPRSLSSRGMASLRGRTVPVVGRVTMDMTMLDVTDTGVEVGDVCTLIGTAADVAPSDVAPSIDVASVAAVAGTSAYELLTGLRSRLRRVYRTG